jgi:hypothetical protein
MLVDGLIPHPNADCGMKTAAELNIRPVVARAIIIVMLVLITCSLTK